MKILERLGSSKVLKTGDPIPSFHILHQQRPRHLVYKSKPRNHRVCRQKVGGRQRTRTPPFLENVSAVGLGNPKHPLPKAASAPRQLIKVYPPNPRLFPPRPRGRALDLNLVLRAAHRGTACHPLLFTGEKTGWSEVEQLRPGRRAHKRHCHRGLWSLCFPQCPGWVWEAGRS